MVLQLVDHPQAVQIVLEAAVGGHALPERCLAGVAEGRMSHVVDQGDRLGQVFVDPEEASGRAGNLGRFQRMGEAGPVVVALVVDEDLRLILQLAEGAAVDDPVAVALIGGTQVVLDFRRGAPARIRCFAGVRGEEVALALEVVLPPAKACRGHAASASARSERAAAAGSLEPVSARPTKR